MKNSRPKFARVRLYESIRTAHLERAQTLEPATILFRTKRYDFDSGLTSNLDLIQADPLQAARLLAKSRPQALEINEPLMLSSLPATALALAALSVSQTFSKRKTRVVTYAIGNADPFQQMASTKLKTRIRRKLERVLARAVWRRVDRVAFGTEAAQQQYFELLAAKKLDQQSLIPALPEPCDCNMEISADPLRVVYLGDLSIRKGFPNLVEAWPLVRESISNAKLTILGKGALEDQARELPMKPLGITTLIDPSRSEIHRQLREAQILVLPSQASKTWREQVGLPIIEGLAHGTRIVTTSETGIATWLAEHGHEVIEPDSAPQSLADAIIRQLSSTVSADEVLSSLPARDGRLAADAWLFDGIDTAG